MSKNMKPDLDRCGLFKEIGFLQGPYISPNSSKWIRSSFKGRQMLTETPKIKTALQDCYLDKSAFKRIFENEGTTDMLKFRRKFEKESKKKNVSNKTFMPPTRLKPITSPGDYYGTFSGKIQAMDPVRYKLPPTGGKAPKNVITNPGKKGGPGYVDITFAKYPEYKTNPYTDFLTVRKVVYEKFKREIHHGPFHNNIHPEPYFNKNPYFQANPGPTYYKIKKDEKKLSRPFIPSSPGKKLGGCKAGCFHKYPEHSNERYFANLTNLIKKSSQKPPSNPMVLSIWNKTYPVRSIVNLNIDFKVNTSNYKSMKPFVY